MVHVVHEFKNNSNSIIRIFKCRTVDTFIFSTLHRIFTPLLKCEDDDDLLMAKTKVHPDMYYSKVQRS